MLWNYLALLDLDIFSYWARISAAIATATGSPRCGDCQHKPVRWLFLTLERGFLQTYRL